jgi:PDZ domain (Also known as DHR or GLGF).
MFVGVYEPSVDIFEVSEGSPAYEAGLKAGDKIVQIEEVSISNDEGSSKYIEEFKRVINEKGNQPINIVIERDGELKQISLNRDIQKSEMLMK